MAIVLANYSVYKFGAGASIINAFAFIGLDLTARDGLHEFWIGRSLAVKMYILILVGSLLSFALGGGVGRIAIASAISFGASASADAVVYAVLYKRARMIKTNGSNLAGALVDSLLFPTLAFGSFMPAIVAGQFVAKVAGGFIWSLILGVGLGRTPDGSRT